MAQCAFVLYDERYVVLRYACYAVLRFAMLCGAVLAAVPLTADSSSVEDARMHLHCRAGLAALH